MSHMTIVAIGPRVTDKTDKMVMGRWPTLHDENRARARRRDFLSKPRGGLVGSSPRLLQGLRGASGPDGARSGRPVGAEPRVEVEAHRGIIVYFIRRWSRYWFSETNALHASRNSRAA